MLKVYTTITRSIDFLYKLRSLLAALSRKKVGLPIKIWYDVFQTSVFYNIFKNEIVFCVYFF